VLERLDIEDMLLFGAIGIEAAVVEQDARVPRPARYLVEARRAELIGIDVCFVNRYCNGGELREGFHDFPYPESINAKKSTLYPITRVRQ
jgi:hypothetical protein